MITVVESFLLLQDVFSKWRTSKELVASFVVGRMIEVRMEKSSDARREDKLSLLR